jgi:4-amino-4-deoxy-L-arabinose transferase-like glycosyltransferase
MLAADATPRRKPRSRQLSLALDARAVMLGVALAGFALRLVLLDRFAFHPDEAIYSFWALYGRTVDPLFLQVWPDKPPILIWVLGWLFDLVGATPVIARLPNVVFSTLTIVVVGALARHWWGVRAGLLAALLMAFNPFAISFAATAFTDPLMVMAGLLALYAAVRRRYFWSGLWLGVAIMTKQQGLLFAPLMLAGVSGEWRVVSCEGRGARGAVAVMRWLVGLLVVVAPILYWDSLRWAVAPSPWDLGARNAAGFTLAAPDLWLARLWAWLDLARRLLGGEVWLWLLALGAALASVSRQRRPALQLLSATISPVSILAVWAAGFLALHVITTVQVWDRYLLPLAPVAALLGAFLAEWMLRNAHPAYGWGEGRGEREEVFVHRKRQFWIYAVGVLLLAVWLLLLTGPAIEAAQGRLPIGGDRGAYTGVEQVAAWLEARADAAPVVYHRTLGWHFPFLLFAPMQEGRIDVRWIPSAVQLADNAAKTPHRPRYWVEVEWAPARDLAMQLAVRRLAAYERLRVGRFTLYEIVGTPTSSASWRVCTPRPQLIFSPGWQLLDDASESATQNRCAVETLP